MPHSRPAGPQPDVDSSSSDRSAKPSAAAPRRVTPAGRTRWGADERRQDGTTRVRFGLQQRAPHNFRRHVVRAARRVVVLLVADLAGFWVMRALVRGVRDHAALGSTLAGLVTALAPRGILNGWQFAAALLVGLVALGNYGQGDERKSPRRLFAASALATALPLWMTLWTSGFEIVATQYVFTTVMVWLGLVVERRILDRVAGLLIPAERRAPRTLFVGPGSICREVMETPAFATPASYRRVGFVDTSTPPAPDALGHIRDVAEVLHSTRPETVVVCGHLSEHQFQDIVDVTLAAGCQLLSVPRATVSAGVQPTMIWTRGQALIELTRPSLKGRDLALKRVVDLLFGVIGAVLVLPLGAVIAAVVKLDSAGPVFFVQERVGQGGRRFRIVKFRTMVLDAESRRAALMRDSVYGDGRLFKIPADPRMTRVGKWLRQTSLDELPQLWNVIRGDMSLVGPRPPLPSEVALYEAHHYARFDVKPGITGPWQVNGRSRVIDFEEVVRLDRQYIEQWSLWLDLAIMLRTVPAVLFRAGAY